MKEQWKPIKNYEGYEVSNFGEVKSLERFDSRGHRRKEKLLSPVKNSKGYLKVDLYKNGVRKNFKIHRLVYSAFVGEIPEDMQVNHLDENKENNRVDNLNLMTSKENNNWGARNAKVAAAKRGKKCSEETKLKIAAALRGKHNTKCSKVVEAIDKVTGRVVFVFPSIMEAGRQGFNSGHISDCCNGERKSHKGFIWRYKENAQKIYF